MACLIAAHNLVYPLLHLVGSLVGKGQCQYAPGLQSLHKQISHLIGKHACLSRAGSCNDERRSVAIFHGSPLTIVQVSKYSGYVLFFHSENM